MGQRADPGRGPEDQGSGRAVSVPGRGGGPGGGVCGGGTPVLPPAVNDSVSLVGDGPGTTTRWTDAPGPYNVYRGTRSGGSPWAYDQTCHEPHIAASSAPDSENPAIGAVFFYLVTRVDACGESIPGQDSGGRPDPNPSPCP